MTYEELWAAQVRTRARCFAHIYSRLQHLIKSRTKAGYIHGFYSDNEKDCLMQVSNLINHNSDTIKVAVSVVAYPPNNRELRIHFITKR